MQQPAFLNFRVLLNLSSHLKHFNHSSHLHPQALPIPRHFHSARVVIAEKPLQTPRATTLPTTSSSNSPSRTFRTFHLVHHLPQSISSSAQVAPPKISLPALLPAARPPQTPTFHPKAFSVKTLKNRKSPKNSNGQRQNRKSWIRMSTRR